MRILMVGAGAVGQAYGWHLRQGGAELDFFVREKYLAELRDGVTVYPLNRRDPWAPVTWRDFGLQHDWAQVAQTRYDQVWVSISSTGLRSGVVPELAAAVGDTPVVSLQPGLLDRELLLEHLSESQLLSGVITLQGFHAPLAGQTLATPGIAWWFPPLGAGAIPIGGPAAEVERAVRTLKRGGCPARAQPGQVVSAAPASALMMPVIAALERAGWSFDRLRSTDNLALGCAASQQCAAIVAGRAGRSPPLTARLLQPWTVSLLLRLAPLVMPFDLERFFEAHFTKVGDQTRLMLQTYVDEGAARGLPTDRVAALHSALSLGADPTSLTADPAPTP